MNVFPGTSIIASQRMILDMPVCDFGWADAFAFADEIASLPIGQTVISFLNANNANLMMRDPEYRAALKPPYRPARWARRRHCLLAVSWKDLSGQSEWHGLRAGTDDLHDDAEACCDDRRAPGDFEARRGEFPKAFAVARVHPGLRRLFRRGTIGRGHGKGPRAQAGYPSDCDGQPEAGEMDRSPRRTRPCAAGDQRRRTLRFHGRGSAAAPRRPSGACGWNGCTGWCTSRAASGAVISWEIRYSCTIFSATSWEGARRLWKSAGTVPDLDRSDGYHDAHRCRDGLLRQ